LSRLDFKVWETSFSYCVGAY